MRKTVSTALIFSLFLSIAPLAFAADNPIEKFNRGIVNVITAPIEIAKQIDKGWKESSEKSENVGKGIFAGFLKGILLSVGRLGSGVWDIVTFPIKSPKNYEPLLKPDYVLQK